MIPISWRHNAATIKAAYTDVAAAAYAAEAIAAAAVAAVASIIATAAAAGQKTFGLQLP